jgi:hypothetical protein
MIYLAIVAANGNDGKLLIINLPPSFYKLTSFRWKNLPNAKHRDQGRAGLVHNCHR